MVKNNVKIVLSRITIKIFFISIPPGNHSRLQLCVQDPLNGFDVTGV